MPGAGSPHFKTFEDASSHVTQVQQVQGISRVYGVYGFRGHARFGQL